MKKTTKLLGVILFAIIILFVSKSTVQAKSYKIENMDIQATINKNGSVSIKQEITYNFNGSYNGIYIDIPYNLEYTLYQEIGKNGNIDDDFYNGDEISVNSVSLIQDGKEKQFNKVNYAYNGDKDVYVILEEEGIKQIRVYSPSEYITKTFKFNYIINNLCVKHDDVGELYYNFIGGKWEVEIENLNIDIYIPGNTEEINIWGHGPYNGKSKIINNAHSNFQVTNVKPGQYVAARVLFNKDNIPYSQKLSHINAKEMVYMDENAIIENKEEKNAFTVKIIIFAICMFIYWVILMLNFEKDKKYPIDNINEEELFKKYNPMIAGCIQGSRDILARDIIAVILGLINKKIILLDISQSTGKDNYYYRIKKNKELENKMDKIEKYVYDWVFESKNRVRLNTRLEEMPKEKQANKKFKELNKLVGEKLSSIGANKAKVPLCLRVFNVFLFILAAVVIFRHIMFNSFGIYKSLDVNIISNIVYYIIVFSPFLMGLLYLPINLIIIIRHKINKAVQRITGQRVVTTTVSLLILFGIIIILTAIFLPEKYIVSDEVLMCIATILILTDNLMLKNNSIMIEDYSKLNALKEKIENYSLMEDRDIEQVLLWEQYLSYSVSFGIANKIIKRIKGLNLDEDLEKLLECTSFMDVMKSDYGMFYAYASLDRRFMKSYGDAAGKMLTSMLDTSGRRRVLWWTAEEDFLVAGGFSGGWR